jgi:microcompartment protein CcmK/EutM
MKLARVVGTVVLSPCIEPYQGKVLHLTQDLDETLEPVGDVEVSATWKAMLQGDLVIVEVAREAANAFEPQLPSDATIIGKVEKVHVENVERR